MVADSNEFWRHHSGFGRGNLSGAWSVASCTYSRDTPRIESHGSTLLGPFLRAEFSTSHLQTRSNITQRWRAGSLNIIKKLAISKMQHAQMSHVMIWVWNVPKAGIWRLGPQMMVLLGGGGNLGAEPGGGRRSVGESPWRLCLVLSPFLPFPLCLSASWPPWGEQLSRHPSAMGLTSGPEWRAMRPWTENSETINQNIFPPFKLIFLCTLSQWRKANVSSRPPMYRVQLCPCGLHVLLGEKGKRCKNSGISTSCYAICNTHSDFCFQWESCVFCHRYKSIYYLVG